MDKLMDNPWFIKGLALVLAILLYSSIDHPGRKLTESYVPGEEAEETIKDFPVTAYYDTENLVVSGIPDTVDITIKGPITHVQTAKALRNFEVVADLTNVKIGKQRVKLEVRDLSDKLKAEIKPKSVNVTIQEKITKEFPVEVEFNANQVEDGFSSGKPLSEPKKVKITGAKSEIDRIVYVKAVLEVKNVLKETITKEARIQVLDKDLNKLNVVVEPETVKVTVPIKQSVKTVPINVVKKGTPPAGVTIQSIELDQNEAVITASEEVLKKADSVRVEVDVSKISDNTTLELPVIISNGITKVTPQMVKATVTVLKEKEEEREEEKEKEKTVSGVPIQIQGLPQELKAQITDPANKRINIVVNGPTNKIDEIDPNDFRVYVDLTNLQEGSHQVNIHVEGPPDIKWEPEKSLAKITITNNV
ncbi:CdaR family protein [Neobacillus thermocopriae]|uniref:YbbR-like domain-containing protein n=1 Tax=Neobacillus thermocopriae TaxID=1215031 RepID=A0A6B3TRJ7_9BACI|nr:CdaR family protein [Neobacillus thermocopriae]MED3622955.1 CdaR family protein [Neobacillus thermocopriae]MED3713229.1 CdaR family protein [Neobacillus thermocopriae]NEX79252.1 YbbR-like domain-containing protein [Neobacillus thermocopriae]